jgi:hypothetical protein
MQQQQLQLQHPYQTLLAPPPRLRAVAAGVAAPAALA